MYQYFKVLHNLYKVEVGVVDILKKINQGNEWIEVIDMITWHKHMTIWITGASKMGYVSGEDDEVGEGS